MARSHEPGMPRAKRGTGGSGKWSAYNPNANSTKIGWGDVDVTAIALAISAITDDGAAVLFSKSRDGGTLVITLCDGDERMKYYATEADEMGVHLRELVKLIE